MPPSDSYSNELTEFDRRANAEFFAWVKQQAEAQMGRPLTVVVEPPTIVPKWLYDQMQEMDDG